MTGTPETGVSCMPEGWGQPDPMASGFKVGDYVVGTTRGALHQTYYPGKVVSLTKSGAPRIQLYTTAPTHSRHDCLSGVDHLVPVGPSQDKPRAARWSKQWESWGLTEPTQAALPKELKCFEVKQTQGFVRVKDEATFFKGKTIHTYY